MSVRKNQRNENRFTVLDAALDLYDHTASIVCNPKYDKCRGLADRIEYESAMIYHYCRSANEDYDNRVQEQAKIRLKLQYDAIEQCKWLKTVHMLLLLASFLQDGLYIYSMYQKILSLGKN